MKRKMRLFIIIVGFIMLLSFTACGDSIEIVGSTEASANEPVPQNDPEQDEDTTEVETVLSDDLFSQEIRIEDTVYTFPVETIQSFLDQGWESEGKFDHMVPPKEGTDSYYFKNNEGVAISLWFANDTSEEKPITQCQVIGIAIDKEKDVGWNKWNKVFLPKEITVGTSYQEVLDAYGDPVLDNYENGQGVLNYENEVTSIGVMIQEDQVAGVSIWVDVIQRNE